MAITTTQKKPLYTIVSLLVALLLGLGTSGCSVATPEEIAKRDELYKAEFIRRGFTEPIKFGDGSGFAGDYSDWGAGLGACRLEFRIHDGVLSDWEAVSDTKTLFASQKYTQCRE